MVRGFARELFFKVCLYYFDDLCRVLNDFVGDWVSHGVEFGLVFSVSL